MNRQLVLVSEPRVRHDSPDTSRAAAASVAEKASELELAIGFYFAAHGAMTDDELCALFDPAEIAAASVKTARSRLKNRGVVADSGVRRLGARKRSQIVWALCE